MAIVVFDASSFRTMFPQWSDETKYSDEYLQQYFGLACEFIPNNDASFIPYDPENGNIIREILIYRTMCHLLTLADMPNNQVGRVASASQGSVSTSFDLLRGKSDSSQWWMQTQCGALVWQLLARYRLGGRINAIKRYHPWG